MARPRRLHRASLLASALVLVVIPCSRAAVAAQRLPGTIAFTGARADDSSFITQIYEARPDGRVTQVTHDPRGFFASSWSPDGSRLLAVQVERSRGTEDLFVLSPGGTVIRRIATRVASIARWSPDGTRIAFMRGRDLMVVGADGSRLHVAARRALAATSLTWSPDGTRLAIGTRIDGWKGIYIVPADGSSPPVRVAVRLPPRHEWSLPTSITWSPRGTRIAFEYRWSVYITNLDGSDTARIRHFGTAPSWSPDGSHLAFAGLYWNYVVRSDGSSLRRIPGCVCIHAVPGWTQVLSWSPGGTRLAYSGGLGQHTDGGIYVVRVDGSGRARVARDPALRFFDALWRPGPR